MRCSHGPHNGLVSQIARLIDSTLLTVTHRGYSSKPAGRGLASGLLSKRPPGRRTSAVEVAVAVTLSWVAGLVLAWAIDHLSKTLAPMALRDP